MIYRLLRPAALALLLSTVALALSSCRETPDDSRQSGAVQITVAAAANLTDAFNELGGKFTERTGVSVVYSFGSTVDLAKQIEQGAPFDVFASADVKHVDALQSKNLLTDGTRALYARGRLVLWLPAGSRARAERLEDLGGDGVGKLAVAKPELAPYGQAAAESLRALGLWERVGPKIVFAQNVAQAKQFAATGNADAAFLPRSLVRPGEGRALEVEGRLHAPLDQAVAVVRASGNQEAARKFVEFVTGAEGQELLGRYGYERPAP